ncbi:MAG: glycosyltransferase, partial [Bacteroidales bacterium]
LYYDSHEYFTEVPELQSNLFAKKVWERLEKYIFPKLNFAITVCDSIAKIYTEKYHIPVFTIRNVPLLGDLHSSAKSSENCQNKPISLNSPYILYQGAVNVDRGLEEIIDAMEFITSTSLVIAGKGDILEDLKKRVADKKLEKKVIFLGAISPFDLQAYTLHATIGLSIEKDSNLNYKYCLPNKLFDYIRCGIPVLVSPLVEIKKIVDRFSVGEYIQDHDPQKIAQQIINMISQKEKMETYRKNTFLAKKELCWDQEEKKLLNIIEKGYDTTPNHLHIIAFNVPYPANYGGVIDVFYKLKALSECGVQITLHCFLYNREKAQELEKYCKKIYYYPRRSAFTAFGLTPYIVKSRMHRDLLINLLKDRDPILMEGHHDSGFIGNQKLSNRFILLRPCNIEHLYYKNLCTDEKRWIPKFYFAIESFRLKFFEKKIKRANVILPISIKDAEYYKKKFPENKVELLNAFHPSEKVEIECSQDLSPFLLFHGDLSVSSNEKVAFYLLDALKDLPYPLVFAGKKPSPRLKLACQQYPRVC